MKKETKSNKRKLIIISCILLGALLILSLITFLLPSIYNWLTTDTDEPEELPEYEFYPVDYNEDIFADEKYMSLISNGMIKYQDGSMKITITEANRNTQDEATKFLINMLYHIQQGNVAEYNACFSNRYFENNAKKENFTKQKIHKVELAFGSEQTVTEDNLSYTLRIYKLSYCIYENNGTFRRDIIDDFYRTQYIYVSNREGKILIDNIQYLKIK